MQQQEKKRHVWNKKQAIEWDTIFEEVDRLAYDVKGAILDIKWDDLKKSETDLDRAIVKKFIAAGQTYNNIARQNIMTQTRNERIIGEALPTLPTFFRVKDEEVKIYHSDGTVTTDIDKSSMSFYIFAPLAQDDVTNQFSMLLHPNQHSLCPDLPVGDPNIHDFKPSLTKCTILHRTYYKETISTLNGEKETTPMSNGDVDGTGTAISSNTNKSSKEEQIHPVTIVQLEPRTGRRHQLRIHMALIGHPMAGDATYYNPPPDQTNIIKKRRTMVDRLCLHSTQLHVPNLLGPGKDLSVTCESPFRFHETNKERANGDEALDSYVTIDTI
jgi:hypothetical protein